MDPDYSPIVALFCAKPKKTIERDLFTKNYSARGNSSKFIILYKKTLLTVFSSRGFKYSQAIFRRRFRISARGGGQDFQRQKNYGNL